jgi:hypothetical protein
MKRPFLPRMPIHGGDIRLAVVSLILILLGAAVPQATGEALDGQSDAPSQQAPDKAEPIPKIPPPPIFPKHRRGLYLNGLGLDVLDATPQSPPLDTDDPGVPEKGEYEVNLTIHADLSRHAKEFDLLFVDANYGLLPKVLGREIPTQLKFEVPVAGATDSEHSFTAGIGAAKVGLKANFYNSEHHAIELSFYPQMEFVVGLRPVGKGLAEPGQTLIFPLLVSKDLRYVTLVMNAAVNKPIHDSDRHTTGTFGAGLGLPLTRKFATMAELHSDTRFDSPHNRLLTANLGLMRSIGHTVVLYTNGGHSLVSDDGQGHAYVGVGLKVLIRSVH